MGGTIVLSRSGRLSVIVAIGPATSYSRVSKLKGGRLPGAEADPVILVIHEDVDHALEVERHRAVLGRQVVPPGLGLLETSAELGQGGRLDARAQDLAAVETD